MKTYSQPNTARLLEMINATIEATIDHGDATYSIEQTPYGDTEGDEMRIYIIARFAESHPHPTQAMLASFDENLLGTSHHDRESFEEYFTICEKLLEIAALDKAAVITKQRYKEQEADLKDVDLVFENELQKLSFVNTYGVRITSNGEDGYHVRGPISSLLHILVDLSTNIIADGVAHFNSEEFFERLRDLELEIEKE